MSDTTLSAIIPADTAGGCRDPAPAVGLDEGAPEERRAVSLAERLKALADPTRLRMLDLLARQREPLCVCEITARFPLRQPTISHHIRLLREAGLVAGEKRGVWSYYWATDAGQRCLVALAALG
ncbi:MAG TPA: metalloregulator ArsR/SmtB family transcription factor [Ktedonobacterales bacterium]|jgi:ArsR family transcriptional regulator|nr:metalloregulator ArsR/SmtB family transcription factor [Ktedonobacterales bacterium]